MVRAHLPRVLKDGAGHEVLVPATAFGSSSTESLVAVDVERAAVLTAAAVDGGGLWLVQGEPWARVVTARQLLDGGFDHVSATGLDTLFEGGPPKAHLLDGYDDVDLFVPVDSWETGQSFYFHSEARQFASVPVLSKRNHRVIVRRGEVDDDERKAIGRRISEDQTCGVLANELGGVIVVPDGEVATDVRALHAERVRFIVDGIRDLSSAAEAIGQWAERFAAASVAGWVLTRPIENSFVYAVNRRRLRDLLPLPAPRALVPVGAAYDAPRPADDLDYEDAVLVVDAEAERPETDDVVLMPAPPPEPEASLAPDLVDYLVSPLTERSPIGHGTSGDRTREGTMSVLRRNVFRRPRGSLLRPGTTSRLAVAEVVVRAGQVNVLRGHLPDDAAGALAATIEAEPAGLDGDWVLCRGAFGYVLAEMGSPQRVVEAMSSSVTYAHLLDGSETLGEAADRLAEVARRLDALAAQGWTLSQPIAGFWLRLRAPRSLG